MSTQPPTVENPQGQEAFLHQETSLPKEDMNKWEKLVERIEDAYGDLKNVAIEGARMTVTRAFVLGRELQEAKDDVGHGKWGEFLRYGGFGFSHRSADRYMDLCENRESLEKWLEDEANSPYVANFTLTAAEKYIQEQRKKEKNGNDNLDDNPEQNDTDSNDNLEDNETNSHDDDEDDEKEDQSKDNLVADVEPLADAVEEVLLLLDAFQGEHDKNVWKEIRTTEGLEGFRRDIHSLTYQLVNINTDVNGK